MLITSTYNQKVKQIAQWQTKAKQRRQDDVFLAEGLKMYEEAPLELIREVYLTESLLKQLESRKTADDRTYDKAWHIEEKLKHTGYETVAEEVFRRMSDTQTPQGILTVLRRPVYETGQLLRGDKTLLLLLEDIQDPGKIRQFRRLPAKALALIADQKSRALPERKTAVICLPPQMRRVDTDTVFLQCPHRLPHILHIQKRNPVYGAHRKGEGNMQTDKKIGFIGLGNMAAAMIGGMLQKGVARPENIIGSARTAATCRRVAEQYGIVTYSSNMEVAQQAEILFLAVKPQFFPEVIGEIHPIARAHTGTSLQHQRRRVGHTAHQFPLSSKQSAYLLQSLPRRNTDDHGLGAHTVPDLPDHLREKLRFHGLSVGIRGT